MSKSSMTKLRILAVAGAVAAIGLSAAEARAQAAGQWKDGAHVYAKICANCHETGVGPVIKGRQDLAPDYYQFVVRNGLRAMPAFRITDIDQPVLKQLSEMLPQTPASGGGK